VDLSDGGIYSGVFSPTLTLTSVSSSCNGHKYRCRVVNIFVGVGIPYNSDAATLTVNAAVTPEITITQQPQDITVTEGAITESLTVVATITQGATLTYQWLSNGTPAIPISGATSATYKLPTDLKVGTYPYACVLGIVSGMKAAAQTEWVTVTVKAATTTPTLTVSPSTLSFLAAGDEKIFAVASNTDWTVTKSAGASWLTVSPASGSNDGTVTVTAAANTAASDRTASITVSGGGINRTVSVTQAAAASTPVPVITTTGSALSKGTVGAYYSVTLEASNNPASWAVTSGALPDGLKLNTATGEIYGIPATAGVSNFTITAKNDGGVSAAKSFSITIDTDVANENIAQHNLKASVQSGALYVSGLTAGRPWSVYNIFGQLVYQGVALGDRADIPLHSHGMYIVRCGDNAVKVSY
jgi:hypothetical protein